MNKVKSKHNDISKLPPLAKEIPYLEFIDDCIVFYDKQTKAVSMGAGFKITGQDIECWDEDTINNHTIKLRTFLNNLPDGLFLQLTYHLKSNYDDWFTEYKRDVTSTEPLAIEISTQKLESLSEQQKTGNLFRPELVIFFRYSPIEHITKKFKLFESAKTFQARTQKQHEALHREVEQIANNITSSLSGMGLESKRLKEVELIHTTYEYLNPTRSEQLDSPKLNKSYRSQDFSLEEIKENPALSSPTPREQILFSDLVHNEDHIFFDGYYHQVISLKTLPEFTQASMIRDLLVGLPFHFYLSLNLEVPEQSKELSLIQQRRKITHALSASNGLKASDLESEAKLSDTEDLLREIISTGQKIIYGSMTIILKAKEKQLLDRMSRVTLSKIRELNSAEGMLEREASLQVFFETLPLTASKMTRSRRMKTSNVADFLPLYEPTHGSETPACLFKNREKGLFKYDPFSPSLPNYSTLVTGASGSGKSFLNTCILTQFLKLNPWLGIIDIGGSYKKLVTALNGDYFEVKLDEQYAINPFQLQQGETTPSNQKIKSIMALLDLMLCEEGQERISKLERNLLEKAVVDTYVTIQGRFPLLSDLRASLQESIEPQLQRFAKMLYTWCEGPYATLLNRPSTLSLNKRITAFDLNGLQTYPDLQACLILIITSYMLDRIEREPGKKLILMDEVWSFLKGPAVSFMEYAVRAGRKKNTGIIFITQGLSEIIESPICSAILNNTANKFILMQRGGLEQVKQVLKLNEQEINLISSLEQKRGEYSEAFLINNDKRSVIRICPTPLEYWIATTHPADNETIKNFQVKFPDLPFTQLLKTIANNNSSTGIKA